VGVAVGFILFKATKSDAQNVGKHFGKGSLIFKKYLKFSSFK